MITWLERGDCNKRNAGTFYSMIQSTNSHVRRLMTEKGQYEEELAKFREQTCARMQGVVMQCKCFYCCIFMFCIFILTCIVLADNWGFCVWLGRWVVVMLLLLLFCCLWWCLFVCLFGWLVLSDLYFLLLLLFYLFIYLFYLFILFYYFIYFCFFAATFCV